MREFNRQPNTSSKGFIICNQVDLCCDEKPDAEIKGTLSCTNMLDNRRLMVFLKFNKGVNG